ncbi:MAG TPA: glycosyl hydrolase family 5 [Fibrobacter sp.]|nr:glycosyl hydrolase family 5 [Fibrobacter sp.]
MKKWFLCLAVTSFVFADPAVYNQIGFNPKAAKKIVVRGNTADSIEIKDITNGKTVLKVKATAPSLWEASGEKVQVIDISKIETQGTYLAFDQNKIISNNIFVQENAYINLTKGLLKWFYYQRAGLSLEAKYAGKWARLAGHLDTAAILYGTEQKRSSPKGWYDAGDYGKYIVNSGISVFTLLNLYEHFPKFCDTLSWQIPESRRGKPDLLSEVRWNLDWMMTMQDDDGGVFHKLTTPQFSGSVMPHEDTAIRVILPKTTAASLDFAAVMAQASRVYQKNDPRFAKNALEAAKKAYQWAKTNPNVIYKQPADVNTGSYVPRDENNLDEFRFAAAELFTSTTNKAYLKDLEENPFNANGPWWGDVNFLAVYRIASTPKLYKTMSKTAKDTLIKVAEHLKEVANTSAYGLPIEKSNWVWGSNSAVANNGIILLYAYYLTKDTSYLNSAQQALDYVLGRNPLNMSYVSGFGFKSPKEPHHRPSEADAIDDPVPGMVAGGPHSGKHDIGTEPWKCKDYTTEDKHALNYTDNQCSYATNEVAINWNAPVAYLAGALQAIYNGYQFNP